MVDVLSLRSQGSDLCCIDQKPVRHNFYTWTLVVKWYLHFYLSFFCLTIGFMIDVDGWRREHLVARNTCNLFTDTCTIHGQYSGTDEAHNISIFLLYKHIF